MPLSPIGGRLSDASPSGRTSVASIPCFVLDRVRLPICQKKKPPAKLELARPRPQRKPTARRGSAQKSRGRLLKIVSAAAVVGAHRIIPITSVREPLDSDDCSPMELGGFEFSEVFCLPGPYVLPFDSKSSETFLSRSSSSHEGQTY